MAQLCIVGDALYVDGDMRGAVAAYSDALQRGDGADAERGACLVGRCGAYLRLDKFEDSVQDALDAQKAVPNNFIAHLRQGQAAFKLGEFESALLAFEAAEAAGGGNEGGITKTEDRRQRCRDLARNVRKAMGQTDDQLADLAAVEVGLPAAAKAAAATSTAASSSSAAKRRRQCTLSHYETNGVVHVTIDAEGVKPEELSYYFAEDEVGVKIERAADVYSLRFVPHKHVRSTRCTCTIKPNGVVLRLAKAEAGEWDGKLVADRKPRSVRAEEEQAAADAAASANALADAASLPNPYSHSRDWGKAEKDIDAELEADKPQNEGALNAWFQQIYARASNDTRRAMNKSMQTSHGSVLSTNWEEVRDKDYEGKDRVVPEGMVLKKWER
jgi:tetratricopeptide (TPR) repeat protein